MKILYVAILAISFSVLLKSARYFLGLVSTNERLKSYLYRFYPWFEIIVWISLILWSIGYLFGNSSFFQITISSLVIILTALSGWYILRDFIAGTVIRSSHQLRPGLHISTPVASGIIKSVGYLSLEFWINDGEILSIPYTSISGKEIRVIPEVSYSKLLTITTRVPQNLGAQNIEKMLRKKILELPWVLGTSDIDIRLNAYEHLFEARISFRAISEDMASQTEEILRDFIERKIHTVN